ncbi:39S ribosomal protein L45, mitochondrial [Juglans microcarpa x Juglans regia]|uniref:39S ribosomal protein L45, mitochondrial n=1 Tax=Juglans microcarpa x Juglans regia TaxID=2249226 RepID=UPI001B7DA60B|nr:39S ribosomal protein L45, mitochondrial [Juglans microcarpa x Juglans regia]
MALRSLQTLRAVYKTVGIRESSYLLIRSRSCSNAIFRAPELIPRSISSPFHMAHSALPFTRGNTMILRSTMAAEFLTVSNNMRLLSTQTKAPPQARQMGALKVSMLSPGIIYEPYAPREPISFWKRWFTRSGWKRTKEDIILELKSAYAISKLRKSGYSKQKFYTEAVSLYKEINTLMANGDKTSLRKAVTEKMYSALKTEIKQRESMWSKVYWEMVEPVIKIRTLRARLIGVDRNDVNKVFVQLTLEFLTKQKFEAYDSGGTVVAGDKSKEVLVRDIWIFEKSLFHSGAYWRLCGRISQKSP